MFAAALGVALTLASCGGGGSEQTFVAAGNKVLPLNATTGTNLALAVVNEKFVFTGGVREFGTVGPTTVTFTPPAASGANPGFIIAAPGGTARGTLAFGSCKFPVTASTFTPPSPLDVGDEVEITDCELTLFIAGTPADGQPHDRQIQLVLNGNGSDTTTVTVTITVTITKEGVVSVNGRVVGNVDVHAISGG